MYDAWKGMEHEPSHGQWNLGTWLVALFLYIFFSFLVGGHTQKSFGVGTIAS
jgi:hypothetical protein